MTKDLSEEQKRGFVMNKLEKQLEKFGLEFEDLPEEKQDELEERMQGIVDADDMKTGATEQLRKALG